MARITPFVDKHSGAVFKKCWAIWEDVPAVISDGELLVALEEAAASAQAVVDQFKLTNQDKIGEIMTDAQALRESKKGK